MKFTVVYSCVLTLVVLYTFDQNSIKKIKGKQVTAALSSVRDVMTTPTDSAETDDSFPGYISLSTNKPLRLSCEECAIVASSGHLIKSNAGRKIDQHQCVIRMNLAPVVGFERDVGARTTIRVVGHRNFNNLHNSKVRHEIIESNTTRTDMIIISWMSIVKDVPKLTSAEYQFAFLLANLYPEVPIYSAQPDRMVLAEELFKNETGFTVKEAHTMLTTGWYTMVHAMELCSNITVYGMAYDDFCSSTNSSVAYHYYEPKKKNECEYYNKSENKPRSGHLFITEKAIFRRWSTYRNITFRHPMWPRKENNNGTLRSPFIDKFNKGIKRKTHHSRRRRSKKLNDNTTSEKMIINSLDKTELTHNNMSANSTEFKIIDFSFNYTDDKEKYKVLNTSAKLTTGNVKPSKRKKRRRKKK